MRAAEVDQRVGGVAQGIRDTRLAAELDALDPRRIVLARVLLVEAAVVDRAGEPLDGERAPPQLGQHQVGDVLVVGDDVALADTVRRVDEPLDVAERDTHGTVEPT